MKSEKPRVREGFEQCLAAGAKVGDLTVQYSTRERSESSGVVIRFVSPVAPSNFLHSLDVISEQADKLLKKLCEMQKEIMF